MDYYSTEDKDKNKRNNEVSEDTDKKPEEDISNTIDMKDS